MNEMVKPGGTFLYPCAWKDIVEPIATFGARFDTFVFVDLNYQFSDFEVPPVPDWTELEHTLTLEGPAVDRGRTAGDGVSRYRDVQPAWRRGRYRHGPTGREITVVFRRGFGQYALHELPDASLGMFLHRGDSMGEGGSGVTYLGNRKLRHPPLSRLIDVIKRKLAYPAWIGSDGSNVDIRELGAAARGDETLIRFVRHGLSWRRVGCMQKHAGRRAVIWEVEPLAQG